MKGIWIGFPVLILLGGVALLRLGLRGRRIDDHPLCRKCGFDLTGRPEGSDKCAECGTDLTAPRAIRHGHRRRRPVILTLGLAIILLFAGVAAVVGWSRVRELDRYQIMPTWYVMREARSTSSGIPVGAWRELNRRLGMGSLSKDQIARATDAALAIQGDRSKPWHATIGDFVEAARKQGDVADPQWQRYARQAVLLTVTLRAQVRRGGDDLPMRIAAGGARVGGVNSGLSVQITDPTIARGELIKPPRHAGSGSVSFGLSSGGGGASSGMSFELDAPAADAAPLGPREAVVHAKVSVDDNRDNQPPVVEWQEDFKATWELVAADAETVKLIEDESHRAAVEQGTTIKFLGTHGSGGSNRDEYLSLEMRFKDIPVPLAHAVVLRAADGREWNMTTINLRGGRGEMGYHTGGLAKGLDVTHVDVVFRPDAHAARHTVDVTEMWNHEFVVKNVPVQRPTPATTPATQPATQLKRTR